MKKLNTFKDLYQFIQAIDEDQVESTSVIVSVYNGKDNDHQALIMGSNHSSVTDLWNNVHWLIKSLQEHPATREALMLHAEFESRMSQENDLIN